MWIDAHLWGQSHHRHRLDQKKAATLSPLSDTLWGPERLDSQANSLELDELWSFVLKTACPAWLWIALCRGTGQVAAYVIGDRSAATCRRLWEAIPRAYRSAHCYTDFWEAYSLVLPQEQHTACGKGTGETAHVERWNNTLRQRLGRFARQSLSFSKSWLMHEACLSLFLHRYNLDRALIRS